MSTRPTVHGAFSIERTYRASPARVFAAWEDIDLKARWFIGTPGQWRLLKRELDFRIGGHELLEGAFADGRVTRFSGRYHDIVPDERIVYVYDMHVDGELLSTSLATVEIKAAGGTTHLFFTEQVVFLDGEDGTASRERGTAAHLDRLGELLLTPEPPVKATAR